MSADARTIAVYNARAGDYDDCFRQDQPDRHLQAFIDALPAGAKSAWDMFEPTGRVRVRSRHTFAGAGAAHSDLLFA